VSEAIHKLSVTDHSTDKDGRVYVYAVLSRRAGGVSLGINLNPNHACNFRCAYCQVEDLTRGGGPVIDLERLERELCSLLDDIDSGDWLHEHAADESAQLVSIAFSGDGEPTTSPGFEEAVALVARVREERGLAADVKLVVITNGSQALKPGVVAGMRALSAAGGEAWFKLDRGTDADIARVNGTTLGRKHALRCLDATADACRTRIQTCWFSWDGEPPGDAEQQAYLDMLRDIVERAVPVAGVLLYGLARPSHQPEAPHLSAAPPEVMEAFAARIRELGLDVELNRWHLRHVTVAIPLADLDEDADDLDVVVVDGYALSRVRHALHDLFHREGRRRAVPRGRAQ